MNKLIIFILQFQIREFNIRNRALRQVGSDIKSWIARANNANVEWFVVIGGDEKKNQTVSWKNLKNRTSGTSSIKDFNVSRETSCLD